MKFGKGLKVEVCKQQPSSFMWRPAEIVSGNGHTYTVRYESGGLPTEEVRVPRKALRPRPPSIKLGQPIALDDIVEVLDDQDGAWKLAEVIGGVYHLPLVRVFGVADPYCIRRVPDSKLRLRLSWEDETWLLVRRDGNKDSLPVPTKIRIKYKYGVGGGGPDKSKKRPAAEPSDADSCNGAITRMVTARGPVIKRPRKLSYDAADINDTTTCSSTGSCSATSGDGDKHVPDDARNHQHQQEANQENDHQRAFYYYYCKMMQFHAEGPLSWDKEWFLSDLRSRLRISQEEHRQVLAHMRYLENYVHSNYL